MKIKSTAHVLTFIIIVCSVLSSRVIADDDKIILGIKGSSIGQLLENAKPDLKQDFISASIPKSGFIVFDVSPLSPLYGKLNKNDVIVKVGFRTIVDADSFDKMRPNELKNIKRKVIIYPFNHQADRWETKQKSFYVQIPVKTDKLDNILGMKYGTSIDAFKTKFPKAVERKSDSANISGFEFSLSPKRKGFTSILTKYSSTNIDSKATMWFVDNELQSGFFSFNSSENLPNNFVKDLVGYFISLYGLPNNKSSIIKNYKMAIVSWKTNNGELYISSAGKTCILQISSQKWKSNEDSEQIKTKNEVNEAIEKQKSMSDVEKKFDDVIGVTWYKYTGYSTGMSGNMISLYMGEKDNKRWLRLRVNYLGSDWIFFDKTYLSYDGNTEVISFDKLRDKDTEVISGGVMEWIDMPYDEKLSPFLLKFINSPHAKIRLSGKYIKDRAISTSEKNGIKAILNLFNTMKKNLGD